MNFNFFQNFDVKILGEAILYSSIQFAIASVEMSSRFSVKNFSKDQEILQNAADALTDYMTVGLLWTFGNIMVAYANHGLIGAVVAFSMNAGIMAWIYFKYIQSFKFAMAKYGLKMPQLIFMPSN